MAEPSPDAQRVRGLVEMGIHAALREGGIDGVLKPSQPFFRDGGSFFRLCDLLLGHFSARLAFRELILQGGELILQRRNLLTDFDALRSGVPGQREGRRLDPLRLLLHGRHELRRAADQFQGLNAVGSSVRLQKMRRDRPDGRQGVGLIRVKNLNRLDGRFDWPDGAGMDHSLARNDQSWLRLQSGVLSRHVIIPQGYDWTD